MHLSYISIIFLVIFVDSVACSYGDRLDFYQRCLRDCFSTECHGTQDGFLPHYPAYYRLLRWGCLDECKYNCMWKTVEELQRAPRLQDRIVPQFHGRWPLVRFFGLEEPASSIFSVLNALTHLIMVIYFIRFADRSYDLFYLIVIEALINIHGWMWSAVFHARDLPFTEKMDYFCAIGIVLYNFVLAALRLLGVDWLKFGGVFAPVLAFYIRHIYNMYQHFDYGYNMKVNVTWAVLGTVLWLSYAFHAYFVRKQKHALLCIIVWTLLGAASMLELFDFSPIAWTFDAHALWHLATVPLTFVLYIFFVKDSFTTKKDDKNLNESMNENNENEAKEAATTTEN